MRRWRSHPQHKPLPDPAMPVSLQSPTALILSTRFYSAWAKSSVVLRLGALRTRRFVNEIAGLLRLSLDQFVQHPGVVARQASALHKSLRYVLLRKPLRDPL